MQRLHGVEVPQSIRDACGHGRVGVLVYDAQVGIVRHLRAAEQFLERVGSVLDAARRAGVPVIYVRHVSLPVALMGMTALRTAMVWQRVASLDEVASLFPPDAPDTQIVPALAPLPDEAVFDKLTMSAFVGTPLDLVLRDLGVRTLVVVGAVLEIGIEPTVRHAADLGYLPILVEDACGVVEADAAARSVAGLDYMLMSMRGDSAIVCEALLSGPSHNSAWGA
jgi:nicotinamidase-related amidase